MLYSPAYGVLFEQDMPLLLMFYFEGNATLQ